MTDNFIDLIEGCPNCGCDDRIKFFRQSPWSGYHCFECGWDEAESFEALRFGKKYVLVKPK